MPLKSRRFCASQYFDCILLCGLYIGLHYTTFFEICTSWNPTGRPVAGLKHGFQGSQAVNISHHFVALKCSLEPPSNIARHSQTQPKTPPVQSFSIKTEDDCMLEECLSQETSGANTQSGELFCLKKSVRFLQLKLNGNWSAYLMELDQFSEVVMNVSSEIAWGDHQGQRMLPSQEEGWVASINRK